MRFSLAMALLLGLAAPDATVAARPSSFPLAPGNRWQLRDQQSETTRTVSVQRQAGALVLQGFPGLGVTRVRARAGGVEAFDDSSGQWESFLRLDAPTGTRYVVRLATEPLWRSVPVKIVSRSAVISDAHERSHRNCVRMGVGPSKGVADAGVEELVFCPGVGPTRIVETTIAGPRTLLLVSSRT